MPREVSEWEGKTDDTALPPRVKIRVFDRYCGCCADCGRAIRGSLRPEYDHIVAIINGGRNVESNIQLLCHECHRGKTASDVREKSRVQKRKQWRAGIKKKRTITRWRKFDGTIVTATRER